MSIKRIILSSLALCLSIAGIACGLLCLLCLIALLLWQGLGFSTAGLALLCLSCLGLAVMLSSRAAKRESKRLGGAGLRSRKSWLPSRWGIGSGSDRGPYRSNSDDLVVQSTSVGDIAPDRVTERWAGDLRSYGKSSEPRNNVGASRIRER
jgi:hypothetical protein